MKSRGEANKNYPNVVAVLTLLVGMWGLANSPGARAVNNVPQWSTHEILLTANNSYSNPYLEVNITATFTHNSCGPKTVKGFWDGGQTYKVRFTPTCTGTWNYSITNNKADAGLTTSGSINSTNPLAGNHGFIRTDGYHFKYDDGTRYFMFGTTAYVMIANAMVGSSWQGTVDYLSSKGINKVRLLLYPWEKNPDVKYPDTQPFTGTKPAPNHDALNLAHWKKFDEIIQYMATKNIVADIIVFSDQGRTYGSTAQDERYTRYAIARFAAYPNVIWDLRNEYQLAPVKGIPYWNNIGLIVRNEDPWMSENGLDRPLSIHGHESGTPANGFAGTSWPSHIVAEWNFAFGTKGLNDPDTEAQNSVTSNYGYNIPVVQDEYGYAGMFIRDRTGQPIFDRTMNRQSMWAIISAGGYATMGDGYDILGQTEKQYVDSGYANWLTGDHYRAAEYDDAARLINFWTARGIEYWLMSPDNAIVQSGTRVYALAESGRQYVFYAALGGSFTVNLPAGAYDARRYNPRTGDDVSLGSKNGGSVSFTMQDSNDWVVYLKPTTPSAVAAIRVNVGGAAYTDGAGNTWSADTGYNTGNVAVHNVAISGTTDDALYQSQRWDPGAAPEMTYSFNVSNGDYTVNLYFAENYAGVFATGARAFSVAMESSTVINSLDIFATVGANTRLVRSVPATVVDGQLNIQFIHQVEDPTIAAIEILSTTPPDTSAPTVPQNLNATAVSSTQVNLSWDPSIDIGGGLIAGYNVFRDGVFVTAVTGTSYSDNGLAPNTAYSYTVSAFDNAVPVNTSAQTTAAMVTTVASGTVIRVNVGGGQYIDSNSNTWSTDTGFNTGNVAVHNVAISGTTDDALYQSQRWDPGAAPEMTYSFNVPNGDYTVNLYFAEDYAGVFATGARVFSVAMESSTVINSLDIFATVGANTKLVRSVPVTVVDGQLNIQFIHQVEDPTIAAIEILSTTPDTSAPTVPQNLNATAVSSTQVNLSWNPSTDIGGGLIAGYNVFRDGVFVTAVTGTSYSDNGLAPNTAYNYTVSAFDNAMPANTSAQTTVAMVTTVASGTVIRVNVGGSQYIDSSSNTWSADTGFNTGNVAVHNVAISGTTDDALYQSQRWDPGAAPEMTYSFNVSNSDYTVNLYFAENYAGVFAAGARVFSVAMESSTVINSLDIFATVGANTKLMRSVPVTVADGQLNIQFIHQVEDPTIAAIEVLEVIPPPP